MAGLLHKQGYKIITNEQKKFQADIWLLNSCTVKNPSEDNFNNLISEAQMFDKKVILSGCVPQSNEFSKKLPRYSIIGIHQIDRIVEVVEDTLNGYLVRLLGKKIKASIEGNETKLENGVKLNLPKIRKNSLIEIIAINTGCLNKCTYCKTKYSRGDVISYSTKDICNRIEKVIRFEGVKEIWLTSEDVGTYGLDIKTNIVRLLKAIAKLVRDLKVKGSACMIRVGMTNPPYIQKYVYEISEILKQENFYEFIHVPIQSASNEVLDDMKRKYNCSDFEKLCDQLTRKIPNIHIMTDFICGFPTETLLDHKLSLGLLKKYKFLSLNISQFYPRLGTLASKMKRVNTKIVKARTREMSRIFRKYSPYRSRIGSKYMILVTEYSSRGNDFIGHNKQYEQIIIRNTGKNLLGLITLVEIIESGKFYMVGKMIKRSRKTFVKSKEKQIFFYFIISFICTANIWLKNYL